MKNESRLRILGQAALEKSVDYLRSSRLYRWFSQWFVEPGQQAPPCVSGSGLPTPTGWRRDLQVPIPNVVFFVRLR